MLELFLGWVSLIYTERSRVDPKVVELCRIRLAARNLHTWTNYSGLDPEVNAGAQANFSTADFLTAPNVRYFTARLALSF